MANQNWATEHLDLGDTLLYVHIGLSILLALAGHLPHFALDGVICLLSPVRWLVVLFIPDAGWFYHGNLQLSFYQTVVCETILMTALIVVSSSIVYVARYYNQPWRFVYFLFERLRVAAILFCVGAVLMWIPFLYMGSAFLFGVNPFSSFSDTQDIQPAQQFAKENFDIALLMLQVSILGFVGFVCFSLCLSIPISFISLLFRQIYLLLKKF